MNQFLVFDEENVNTLSQELYDLDQERINGVSRGRARSDLFNKVMRQCSLMANAIGAMIEDFGGMATETSALKSQIIDCFNSIVSTYVSDNVHNDNLRGNETITFANNKINVNYGAGGKQITEFGTGSVTTKNYDNQNVLFETITTTFNANGSISVNYVKQGAE